MRIVTNDLFAAVRVDHLVLGCVVDTIWKSYYKGRLRNGEALSKLDEINYIKRKN